MSAEPLNKALQELSDTVERESIAQTFLRARTKQEETDSLDSDALYKAFRHYRIDPRKKGAFVELANTMAQFLDQCGMFGMRGPGRTEVWTRARLTTLCEDLLETIDRLTKDLGRKPGLEDIAKSLRDQWPDKYAQFTVKNLRVILSRIGFQSKSPDMSKLWLTHQMWQLRTVWLPRPRAKGK